MKNFFKLGLAALALLGCIAPASAAFKVPAFPGAEGHGRYVTGGRGGVIRHVTNLNDSGEGSLRKALEGSSAKIIVFDVSGYIDLKSNLQITSNTTIAGQTAPEGGITLRYYTVEFGKADNVICRFIRFRRSQVKEVDDGADAAWGRNRTGIIIDHCSFSWSIDEVASFYDNKDFTLQWCTVSEGLANPGHSKGAHSYGGIWGGKDVSFHHNMIAHVQNRAPRFNGARYGWSGYDTSKYSSYVEAERVDFRNCVMYNWGTGSACYGGPGGGNINIVNNYYKAGPGTKNRTCVTQVSVGNSGNSSGGPTKLYGLSSRYFVEGNYVTAAGAVAENYDWKGVSYDSGLTVFEGERYIPCSEHFWGENVEYTTINDKEHIRLRMEEPVDPGCITTHRAETAYERVVEYAGASLWRDACDARYAEEARTGTTTYKGDVNLVKNGVTYPKSNTAGILDFINDPDGEEVEGTASFPELPMNVRPAGWDSDNDGIPDEWEIAHGLNPNKAVDATWTTVDKKLRYTNIECYINSLVDDIMYAGNLGGESNYEEYWPMGVTTDVETVAVESQIDFIEYYDLQGRKVAEPENGICIRRIVYTNGTSTVDKVIKR